MGADRDIALSELPIRGISINTLTGADADITVVPSDSGILFVNKYTTETTYTLPAVADGAGKWFWFFNGQTSAEIKIKGTTACIVGDATDQYATGSADTGTCAFVIGDGTYYYLHEIYGDWAVASS